MVSHERWPAVTRTDAFKEKVSKAKILAVGAGGIGCELLKTLVLSGFQHIAVVDMDTIETSNLNRQFLFRREHVGQSKAVVAAEAVKRLRPDAQITAHQANIKEDRFGIDFFDGFDLVLNGLDNLDARRHVNRMCHAARVPLVESGTSGYTGQVSVHGQLSRAETPSTSQPAIEAECFECQPKAAPKTYPVCTIRNTPDKPIHCVVWAKEMLFQRLFGRQEGVSDLDSHQAAEPPSEADKEALALQKDDASAFLMVPGESIEGYSRRIFDRLYCSDIKRLLSVQDLWKARTKPKPLDLAELVPINAPSAGPSHVNGHANGHPNGTSEAAVASASAALGLTDDHAMWSTADNAKVFLKAIELYRTVRAQDLGAAVFDKEDLLACEFVTAAANLRSIVFGIPTQSLFDTKGMAGNIIHAIATTNAIVSGLIVGEAMKLVANMPHKCRVSWLNERPNPKTVINPVELSTRAPDCAVCGPALLTLHTNTHTATLGDLVSQVLKGSMGLSQPWSITCSDFMYEEDEDLEEDEADTYAALSPRPLKDLPGGGLGNGAVVSIADQPLLEDGSPARKRSMQLIIRHQADWDGQRDPSQQFRLIGSVPAPVPPAGAAEGQKAGADDDEDDVPLLMENGAGEDEDEIVILPAAEKRPADAQLKRKAEVAEADAAENPSPKRRRAE
ncbi:hypothetical protein WJX73_004094 [Symbiochloris irregularis]|uniref:SUMO-activating enzyme subunit n=1 Tax=Symbiochloris irregularis TaxID=706552 RepID=A0AAW1NPE1_9CHLO